MSNEEQKSLGQVLYESSLDFEYEPEDMIAWHQVGPTIQKDEERRAAAVVAAHEARKPVAEIAGHQGRIKLAEGKWGDWFEIAQVTYDRCVNSPRPDHEVRIVYTAPVQSTEIRNATLEECAVRAECMAYMSPNFTALAEQIREMKAAIATMQSAAVPDEALIDAAVETERRACAELCEQNPFADGNDLGQYIRARGDTRSDRYRLVPTKPTAEMLKAAEAWDDGPEGVYARMIAAAPEVKP